jgi:hypothetical protein
MFAIMPTLGVTAALLALSGSWAMAAGPSESIRQLHHRCIDDGNSPVADAPSVQDMQAFFAENLSSGAATFVPGESNYTTDVIQPWNALNPPQYTLAVKPATAEDVGIIIEYAAEHNVSVLGTGGGHGFTTTTSAVQGGIDIDLGFFNGVEVDASNNLVTVGGAVTFNDVLDPLYAAGKEMPTGYCSCVGVVGATLGGGIGPLQGLYGLLTDSLESATVVVASGDVVTASQDENADLFWALRGAGANFGIVTSATYRIHDLSNQGTVLSADFFFLGPQNATIFDILTSYADNAPDEFAISVSVLFNPDVGQPVLMASTAFFGSEEQGMLLNEPFINAGPIMQNITMLPSNRLIRENRFGADQIGCVKGNDYSMFGTNLYAADSATLTEVFNSLAQMYTEQPALQGTLLAIELHPKRATVAVPTGETSFAHRNTTMYTFLSFRLPDEAIEPIALVEGQRIRDILGQGGENPDLQTYVNYAHGDEGPEAWYAQSLPRLRELKGIWDPNEVFSFFNPIPI